MSRILLTGATGFVGRAILARLSGDDSHVPVIAIRGDCGDLAPGSDCFSIGDICATTDWSEAIADVEIVIHVAGRAHILDKNSDVSLAGFRQTNTEGTLHLARQAANAGVRRFVFMSSIGVVGNLSQEPLEEEVAPDPQSPYAISKLEAEQGLSRIAAETGMEVIIVRPPLVYGPGAPGNFDRLLRLVNSGLPLPFKSVRNLRSFIALDNLVDFIMTCLEHPAAGDEIFHVSDARDVSTPELIQLMGKCLGKKARLIACPVALLISLASLVGKRNLIQSLCGSLRVSHSKARDLLEWHPSVSIEEGLVAAIGQSGKNREIAG